MLNQIVGDGCEPRARGNHLGAVLVFGIVVFSVVLVDVGGAGSCVTAVTK